MHLGGLLPPLCTGFLVYLVVFITQKTFDYLKGSVNRSDLVFQNYDEIVDYETLSLEILPYTILYYTILYIGTKVPLLVPILFLEVYDMNSEDKCQLKVWVSHSCIDRLRKHITHKYPDFKKGWLSLEVENLINQDIARKETVLNNIDMIPRKYRRNSLISNP